MRKRNGNMSNIKTSIDTFLVLSVFFLTMALVVIYRELLLSYGIVDLVLMLIMFVWFVSWATKKAFMKTEKTNEYLGFSRENFINRTAFIVMRLTELILAPIMCGMVIAGIFVVMASK